MPYPQGGGEFLADVVYKQTKPSIVSAKLALTIELLLPEGAGKMAVGALPAMGSRCKTLF